MIEGVVNILKPPGMSSSDVVTDVRRIVGTRRVGHAGTLDPGAAGVLPVCIGRATRLFDYLLHGEKEYIAEVAFGVATDSQDAYGTVTERSEIVPNEREFVSELAGFNGEMLQTAPIYSALSVNGTRMYKLARAGEYVEPRVRAVRIEAVDYIGSTGPARFLIKVRCSKGTFVRTLCHDIGHQLGSCAYMSFLLRTEAAGFRIEKSVSIPELAALKAAGRLEEAVLPPDKAVGYLPELRLGALSAGNMTRLINGAEIRADGASDCAAARLYVDDVFVGLGLVKNEEARLSLRFYGEAGDA